MAPAVLTAVYFAALSSMLLCALAPPLARAAGPHSSRSFTSASFPAAAPGRSHLLRCGAGGSSGGGRALLKAPSGAAATDAAAAAAGEPATTTAAGGESPAGSSMRASLPHWATRPGHVKPRWRDVALNLTATSWHSQTEEDQHLFNTYFHNVHHGFYLEMGALDGARYSNTKFFSEALGWHGLLIEPSPVNFDNLIVNRPNDLCVRAAICSVEGTVHYISRVKDAGSATGGIYEFMSDGHKAKFQPNWVDAQAEGRLIAMPCVPLQSLFNLFQIRTIDFWSLDVEGAELEVLKTVDFAAVHISVILVESDGTNKEKEAAVRALLLANSFTSHGLLLRSEWFVHDGFRPHSHTSRRR